jgi:acyl-CoA synthetase (AMP-forming)/AMP-acid ligase II
MINNKTTIALCCAATLSLSGCALTEGLTDKQLTKNEGAMIGVAIGGVAGALLGGKKGALFGAALGGAIGNMFAQHVSKKKEKYADNESYMKAVISESDKVIALSKQERKNLVASIKEQQEALASLKSDQKENKDANSTLVAQQQQLNQSLKRTNNLIKILDQEIAIQKETLEKERESLPIILVNHSKTNQAVMGDEKQKLEKEKQALEKLAMGLASLDQRTLY